MAYSACFLLETRTSPSVSLPTISWALYHQQVTKKIRGLYTELSYGGIFSIEVLSFQMTLAYAKLRKKYLPWCELELELEEIFDVEFSGLWIRTIPRLDSIYRMILKLTEWKRALRNRDQTSCESDNWVMILNITHLPIDH